MPSLLPPAALVLFGGTFDPVHSAHLQLATAASLALSPKDAPCEVLWIPVGIPPHRGKTLADGKHRLAMLRLALEGNPLFRISEIELKRESLSYTRDTLHALREENGDRVPLIWLIGSDAFLGLPSWESWQSLFGLAHFAIAERPGYPLRVSALPPPLAAEYEKRLITDLSLLHQAAGGFFCRFPMPPSPISATKIRQLRAVGDSVQHLLPRAVVTYILKNHLYESPHEN